MKIILSIRELLYQYDCVIVPGFGGFVCSLNPARIHPVQHRFYPPSKKISFNSMLISNDGLLAHHLSGQQGISYESALDQIAETVYSWKKALGSGERISMEGVGEFFNDSQGNLQFTADQSVNYLREAYGLTVFQALPVERKQPLRAIHLAEPGQTKINLSVLGKVARYAAAAALITGGVFTTYKLNLVPEMHKGLVSLNPFKTEAPSYASARYNFDFSGERADESLESKLSVSDADYITFIPTGKEEFIVGIGKEIVSEVVVEGINQGRFHVVGGCFGVEENAVKLVKKLQSKGYQAFIPTRLKDLHVVSYQSFSSRIDAEEMLMRVKREDNAQAWILEK